MNLHSQKNTTSILQFTSPNYLLKMAMKPVTVKIMAASMWQGKVEAKLYETLLEKMNVEESYAEEKMNLKKRDK